MAIDPILAAGVKPVDLGNPLEQHINFLNAQGMQQQNQERQNALMAYERQQEDQNWLNKAYQQFGDNHQGLYDYARREGRAHLVPGLEKQRLEQDKLRAEVNKFNMDTFKTRSEALLKEIEASRELFSRVPPGDAEGLIGVNRAIRSFPLLSEVLPPIEEDIAEIQAALGKGPEALEQLRQSEIMSAEQIAQRVLEDQKQMFERQKGTFIQSEMDGKTQVMWANPYTRETEVVASGKAPDRAGTTVNVTNQIPGKVETKLGETFGMKEGEALHELYTRAKNAPRLAAEADRALDILEADSAFTGKGANVRLQIEKIAKMFGIPDHGKIKNTEELMTILANKTLEAVQTSGLGSSNAFSDKDREFVEKAAGGQITLDRDTLIRLAEIQRRAANFTIQSWNEYAKTAPDSLFQGSGARRNLPLIPERKSMPKPAPKSVIQGGGKSRTPVVTGSNGKPVPPAHIEYLRANPDTRADFEEKYGKAAAEKVLGR